MESDSIAIVAKDDVTLEIARDVAKQSKTLANLIASTDETRHKEPIRLSQFDASTLDKVFEWCEEHSGADPAHTDFSMPATFTNEYPRYPRHKLTPWQANFFDRYDPHKWELAAAASYLDVPYLYFSACFVISESLRMQSQKWDEAVPVSVSDDVLCDVLRFFYHVEIEERNPQEPRWKRIIETNARMIPLKAVSATIEGDQIEVSTEEVFDELESLSCFAVEKLSIDRFGKKECAVVQAFLNEPSARLRVKTVDVGEFPRRSRKAFLAYMSTLKKLAERLNFLEEVRLDLSCDMQAECLIEEPGFLAFPPCVQKLSLIVSMDVDTQSIVGFVDVLYAVWNRSLSIELAEYIRDPLAILAKAYEKFASDGEIAPLLITATIQDIRRVDNRLRQFVVDQGFTQVAASYADAYEDHDVYFEYEKTRGKDWKIAVDYSNASLTVEIKKLSD